MVFSIGDRVICIDNLGTESCIDEGKTYTISEIRQDGLLYFKEINGGFFRYRFKINQSYDPFIEEW